MTTICWLHKLNSGSATQQRTIYL